MASMAKMLEHPEQLNAISQADWEQYQEHGYLIVRDLFAPREVREMLAECDAIHRGDYAELYGGAFQVEPEFAEAAKSNPELAKLARKITYVVERSAVFREYLLKDKMLNILKDILGPDVLLFRDILMMKPAKVGSKMPWHQDSNYWPIEPTDLCSVWTALDEATIENGCMRVVPGSHKLDLIPSNQANTPFLMDEQVDLSKAVDVPLQPGSSLVFHSRLLHGSEPNRSDNSRRAFITSFMSARYKQTNNRGRTRFFLVCGKTHPGCVQSSPGM
jgi:ectoine hydroxylase-related dioxygenase (phytanoyl-CoA dioxygenase family)